MSETKEFSLGALLSVTTGMLLTESFGDVHEVFDHFYPGIMQMGMVEMGDQARDRVYEQHPSLSDVKAPVLGAAEGDAAMAIIRPWLRDLEAAHGARLSLTTDQQRQTPEQNGLPA